MVRVVGMVLAAIPLMAGYALILFDDRRQGLQDKLARTFVLYVPEEAELEPAVVQPDAAVRIRRQRTTQPRSTVTVPDCTLPWIVQ